MAAKVDAEQPTNTLDPKRVEKIIAKIEREHEGLLSERMSYMGKCRPYRERIGQYYEEGIGFGISKKVLKAKIKERALQRQIDGIPDDFEDDDRDLFEQVSQALGEYADTPLGRAAVEAASKPDKKSRSSRKAPSAGAEPAMADAGASSVNGAESEPYKNGRAARDSGDGCTIPNELKGDDRDRWHNGWLSRDAELKNERTAAENAERLGAGITPLH